MKTIDFKNFSVFTDITHEQKHGVDIRRDFADMLYKNLNGIVAHDVALRIYKSDAPVEFNDEEIDLIKRFAEQMTPIFQDSLNENIKEK